MSGLDLRRWSQIRAWFDELIDLEPAPRRAGLEWLGRSDPELRAAVETMLDHDAVAGDRLGRMDFGVAQLLRGAGAEAGAAARDRLGLVGRTIAHFHILEPLASGGMGVVYRARDERLQRIVALKLPLPHLSLDAAVTERFLREARLAGGLDHPNVCRIHEAGESEAGQLYLAMPLYPGRTLEAQLAGIETPTPVDEALAIARQIAEGVACAHAAGIVHRDLKPSNVMVLPDGTVKILDFGLAKVLDVNPTRSGMLLGTAAYMAPEQVRGEAVDARADLWALGVVLYQLIGGRRPFHGDGEISIAHAILHDEPQPLSRLRPDLPRGVEHLVRDLLRKEPAERYGSAHAVAADLAAIARGEDPTWRHPVGWRVAAWLRGHSPRTKQVAAGALAALLLASAGLAAALSLRPAQRPSARNAEAYAFFSRAEEYQTRIWTADNRNAEWTRFAEAQYRRAVELDPGFALPWARLANLHSNEQFDSRTASPAGLERVRREAETALKIDPRLGEAHLVLGFYWSLRGADRRALAAFARAHDYAPANGEVDVNLGEAYAALGRWEDALVWMNKGVKLDPKRGVELASMYLRLRRYREAARSIDRYLQFVPDDYLGMLLKGCVYLHWKGTTDTLSAALARIPTTWDADGWADSNRVILARIQRRPADALAALRATPHAFLNEHTPVSLVRARLNAQAGDTLRARAEYATAAGLLADSLSTRVEDARLRISRAEALAGSGRRDAAEAEIASALSHLPWQRWRTGPEIAAGAAAVYTQLGHNQRALELLERLMRDPSAGRFLSAALLRLDPSWDPLRGDPRFAALLARYPL